MTDITQKLIESEGLIELKPDEHFDPLRLVRSRELVSALSGGVSVDLSPIKQGDGPWQIIFNAMMALFDTEGGYFEDDSSRALYLQPIEPFSNETILFHSQHGTMSKLTHVYISGRRVTPLDI